MAKHSDDRPRPLRHEATLKAVVVGAVAVGSMFGINQVATLGETATNVIELLAAGGAITAAAQATARAGEKYVTPTSDPHDDQGRKLVPIDPTPDI